MPETVNIRHYDEENSLGIWTIASVFAIISWWKNDCVEVLLKILVFGLFSKAYISSIGLMSPNDGMVKWESPWKELVVTCFKEQT